MIPVKIVSKVDIPPIPEAVISALIISEIMRNNPELTVTDVKFERRLSPNRIEAIVEAKLNAGISARVTNTEDKVSELVQEEHDPKSQTVPASPIVDVEKTVESSTEEVQEELDLSADEPTAMEPDEEEEIKPKRKRVFK